MNTINKMLTIIIMITFVQACSINELKSIFVEEPKPDIIVIKDEFKDYIEIQTRILQFKEEKVTYSHRLFYQPIHPRGRELFGVHLGSKSFNYCNFKEAYIKEFGKVQAIFKVENVDGYTSCSSGNCISYKEFSEEGFIEIPIKYLREKNNFEVAVYGEKCESVIIGDEELTKLFLERVDEFKSTGK